MQLGDIREKSRVNKKVSEKQGEKKDCIFYLKCLMFQALRSMIETKK